MRLISFPAGSRTAIWFGPMRLTYRLPDLAKARPVACGEAGAVGIERELVDELQVGGTRMVDQADSPKIWAACAGEQRRP